jgi:putative membrane protein
MKNRPTSILRFTALAVAASALCFIGNVNAQQNTSVSDNPHLRKKDEPAKAPTTKLSDKDRKFIQSAANGGANEVVEGKLAEERGQSAEVKKIGARMAADHARSNRELAELAKKKGLSIDMSKGKPRNFGADRFDGQYLASMESDHKADIKMFEAEAQSGDDAEMKAWASKTLPTLKAHLAMVKDAMKKKK